MREGDDRSSCRQRSIVSPPKKKTLKWYKVILTHQAGHIEFGTFDFCFHQAVAPFDDWRRDLARANVYPKRLGRIRTVAGSCFPDRQLGAVIFEQVEDSRIDAPILSGLSWHPFILSSGSRQRFSRTGRRLSLLPLREAFLEALVQAGLGGDPLEVWCPAN